MENVKTILVVTCKDCRQRYVLPREAAGESKRCRVCQGEIHVPWERYYSGYPEKGSELPVAPYEAPSNTGTSGRARYLSAMPDGESESHSFVSRSVGMRSTTGQVVRRKILRLVTSPLVVLSTISGVLFAWLYNDGVWNAWDSIASTLLALGFGTAVYRFTLGRKKHTTVAREDLRRIGKGREAARLSRIQRSTSCSIDPQTAKYLGTLESAFTRLQQVDRWRCSGNANKSLEIAEIHDQGCRLYVECRHMLERSQELLNGASEMATATVRSRMMKSRGALLDELQTSLQLLDQALDEVYSSQLSSQSQPVDDAAELRAELSRYVEVSRQIEERLEHFHRGWHR